MRNRIRAYGFMVGIGSICYVGYLAYVYFSGMFGAI